ELRRITKPFVLSWDFKMPSSYASTVWITGMRKDGTGYGPLEFYEFNAGGPVKFERTVKNASWQGNTWNRAAMVIYPGNGVSRVFLNGQQIHNGNTAYQKVLDYATDFNLSFFMSIGNERRILLDNMRFYPIDSVAAFDAEQMNSAAATTWDIIKGGEITGYGPGTAEEFLGLFTFPEGSRQAVYFSDKTTEVPLTGTVAEGMILSVTSADGVYTREYPLGEQVRIEPMQLYIDGREMRYMIEADAKGWTRINSALPYPVRLRLTYTDGTEEYTATAERTASDTGLTVLETPIAGTVKNQEGEALCLTLTDALTNGNLAEPISILWTGQLDLGSEIRGGRNGANSIVTITMDDAIMGTLQYANEKFAALGLRGTSMAIADRIAENVSGYRAIFDKGYIDVANHGKTTAPISASATETTATAELTGAAQTLRNLLPGQEVLTYAPANHVLYPGSFAENLAVQNFWAIRRGNAAEFNDDNDAVGYNTLNPPNNTSFGGWYRLRLEGAHNPTGGSLNGLLDPLLNGEKWLIEMYHGIIADGKYSGGLEVRQSTADAHFALLAQYQNEGKIWVASFPEAMKYLRERQNTTLTDVATETGRTVTLTMDSAVLPPEIFNYPLTVRSQIPSAWAEAGKYIKVTQGGSVQSPAVKNIDGGLYADYEVIPNGVSVTLELTDERPAVTVTELKITSSGALTQEAGSMTPITLTASAKPSDNADTSEIYWYIDGVKQAALPGGTLALEFFAEDTGRYDIYVQDDKTGLRSRTVTVVLKEPGLVNYQDFEGYAHGAAVETSTVAAEYPAGNMAAMVKYAGSAYPGAHKTAPAAQDTPIVFSGRVAMTGGTAHKYFLDARDAESSATAAVTLLTVKNGGIYFGNDASPVVARIPQGAWVHYSLSVTPKPNGAAAPVRLTLSGGDLTDANGENAGQTLTFETEKNMDLVNMAANGSIKMVHNNYLPDAAPTTYY
ncbi:MAG: hypothetical protein LBH54_06580, partial [Clostridiales bacterium]|nr:hypothetical protein [Clostridiales bacterium]